MQKSLFVALGISLFSLAHWFDHWKTTPTHADAWGYYAYLPSVFIFNDLATLDSMAATRTRINPFSMGLGNNPLGLVEANQTSSGRYCIKYTMGVAFLQAPFFAFGHWAAQILGFRLDGFSLPYLVALLISAIFWPLFGLWFLRKTLRKYFSEGTVWLTVVGLLFGTNLLHFATINIMSHAYLFGLWCLLIWASDFWYDAQGQTSRFYPILIGLLAGLIALIRPNEVVCLAIPLFWGISNWRGFVERGLFLAKNLRAIGIAALSFALVWLPQMMYWQWVAGEWLHDSYPNEHFDFGHPHLKEGIFGFRNGWLVYTPLMACAVLGVFMLPRLFPKALAPVAVVLPVHLWVIYSWWAWLWVNGYGSRPMVEIYPLLAFPLAVFLDFFWKKRLWAVVPVLIVVFFSVLNVHQHWQWSKGLFGPQDWNRAAYRESLWKTKWSKELSTALDTDVWVPAGLQPDSTIFLENFESPLAADSCFTREEFVSGQFGYALKNSAYCPGLHKPARELGIRRGDWLRISVKVFIPQRFFNCDRDEWSRLRIELKGEKETWITLLLPNKVGDPDGFWYCGKSNVWDEAAFFVRVPDDFPPDAIIKLFVFRPSKNPKMVILDDLKLERCTKQAN